MHALLVLIGAVVVVAYLAGRFNRRAHPAANEPVPDRTAPPGRLRQLGDALLLVLAVPFLNRVLLGILTVLGLIYVYFFGPIKPIHEWLP
jgi:hypothetical protein